MVKTTKKPAKKITPKAKASAKKTPAKKSWVRQMWPKQWLMISLAILLLLVLGYIGLNKYQITQEKKQFDAAASGIDEIYKGIVRTAGQPASSKKVQSCVYSSAKLYEGFLRCGTRYIFSYSINNTDVADSLMKKTQEIVATHPSVTNNTLEVNKYSTQGTYEESGSFNYDGFREKCITSYKLTKDILEIYLGCSGISKAEHYPVKE